MGEIMRVEMEITVFVVVNSLNENPSFLINFK